MNDAIVNEFIKAKIAMERKQEEIAEIAERLVSLEAQIFDYFQDEGKASIRTEQGTVCLKREVIAFDGCSDPVRVLERYGMHDYVQKTVKHRRQLAERLERIKETLPLTGKATDLAAAFTVRERFTVCLRRSGDQRAETPGNEEPNHE